jgi:hypothetical protein
MAEARRTLVKSPPELWAEVSDPDCLAKHLGAFGEIRITRVEPETAVAWEGDRARGTVELEASGWGTKVRLTAEAVEVEEPPADAPPEPVAVAEPEPPAAAPTPEPLAEAAPEPAAEPAPPALDEPAAEQPAVDVPPKRRGFFARLFGRRTELRVTTVPSPPPQPVEEPASVNAPARVEEPAVTIGQPSAAEQPAPVEEPAAATIGEPAAEGASRPAEAAAVVEPEPPGEIRVTRLGDDEAAEVLNEVLDTLGAAHHRPFSR